jgi:hypothetical protein
MAKMKVSTLLGFAALGVGAWYFFGRHSTAAAATTTTDKAAGPRPFGDPADPGSVAFACNAAWRTTALGHPLEASRWVPICTQGGGTVPSSAQEQYT